LSVKTASTARTVPSARSPPTPDAMNLLTNEAIAPLSPVDARCPNSFFSQSSQPNAAQRHESLKSSVHKPEPAAPKEANTVQRRESLTPSVDKVMLLILRRWTLRRSTVHHRQNRGISAVVASHRSWSLLSRPPIMIRSLQWLLERLEWGLLCMQQILPCTQLQPYQISTKPAGRITILD